VAILAGFHAMDEHFRSTPFERHLPVGCRRMHALVATNAQCAGGLGSRMRPPRCGVRGGTSAPEATRRHAACVSQPPMDAASGRAWAFTRGGDPRAPSGSAP